MNPILKEKIERHKDELAKSELRKQICDGRVARTAWRATNHAPGICMKRFDSKVS